MLHHLWILGVNSPNGTSGTVLLSRHFSSADAEESVRDAELSRVVALTRDSWPTLLNEHQSYNASSSGGSGSGGNGLSNDEEFPGGPGFLAVTYHYYDAQKNETERTAGVLAGSDVVIIATGDGEYDALAIEQSLRAFVGVLRSICCKDKEGITEAAVLKEYRTVMLVVEDVFTRGILHTTEPEVVSAFLDMSLEKVKH